MHLPSHLLTYVVRPTLKTLGLPGGITSEKLIMGTAAKESGFDALYQIGGGPALSLWQIEPATAEDAIDRCGDWIINSLEHLGLGYPNQKPLVEILPGNLYLGAALCRVIYYLKPFALPDRDLQPAELAHLWKLYYNSPKGAGKEEEFLADWHRFNLDSLWASKS